MPERPNTVKVDASSVQGEGAYVEWRRMTWGERREARLMIAKSKDEAVPFIFDHLIAWNWVDAEGGPLPIPREPDDLEKLYDEEIVFLTDIGLRAIQGRMEFTLEAEKN